MRKLKTLIGLAAVIALPAFGSAPALAADTCPPGTTNPSYCPAPAVSTLAPSAITRNGATINGQINPHGTTVYYFFQFGTSTSYGSFTTVGVLTPTTATVPIVATLTGLNPGTLYHYRLLGFNNGGQAGVGADVSFSTLPAAKLKTTLTLKAKPKRDKKLPFKYTFSGTVKIPAGVPKASVCGGKVKLTLKKGSKTVGKGTATVSKKCTYKKKITIKSTKKTGKKKGKISVTAKYGGNAVLKSSKKTTKVTFF